MATPEQSNSANKIQTYLFSEKGLAENYGKDISNVTPPETVERKSIFQNSTGEWEQITIVEKDPYPSINSVVEKKLKERDDVVKDYEEVAKPFDSEMYSYNQQINAKKDLIISLVNSAVSAGCSHLIPTSGINTTPVAPGAEDIGGVSCGYGSTLYSDRALIKIYPNIDVYGSENPFDPVNTAGITSSNLGKGFENLSEDNTGSAIEGYEYIPDDLASHAGSLLSPLTPAEQLTCVGYSSEIAAAALEIVSLRQLRDANIAKVNIIKEDKNAEEIRRWGSNQSKVVVDARKTETDQLLSNIATYGDDIVLESLLLYFDFDKEYTVTHLVDVTTGLDEVTKVTDLSTRGITGITSSKPLYDSADGASVVFNKFYPNQYIGIGENFIGSGIDAGDSSYALEVWFKLTDDTNLGTSATSDAATLVGVSSATGYGIQLYKPSSVKINFGSRGNGSLDSSTIINTDTWYHVVCTRESGVGNKIYVNGVLDNSSDNTQLNIISTASETRVGFTTHNILQNFKGKISLVRIYGKNLTQNEVKKNYSAHLSRFTS